MAHKSYEYKYEYFKMYLSIQIQSTSAPCLILTNLWLYLKWEFLKNCAKVTFSSGETGSTLVNDMHI